MSNQSLIESLVQTCSDSLFESSGGRAKAAFHPDARISGYPGGDRQNMSVDEFAKSVAEQQPSAQSRRASLAAARSALLDWRALHITVRTEDAAIARKRSQ